MTSQTDILNLNRPNIILITIDCLRYDRCGFNNHYRRTTPNLDELAQESYIFDHAYATGPYTTESIPGIIAGQHSYNGVYFGHDSAWKAIHPDSATIADYLSSEGYETIATLSNPHLTSKRNFDLGFDHFDNLRTKGQDRAESDPNGSSEKSILNWLRHRFKQSKHKYSPFVFPFIAHRYTQYQNSWPTIDGEDVIKNLCSRLDGTTHPIFAWSHLMDIHAPINPDVTSIGGDDLSLSQASGTLGHLYHIGNFSRSYPSPAYDHRYDFALRYVDHQIETIVESLKSSDQWNNTIVIVSGDHGEAINDRMGIHGHPRHHHYDELLRVPLLIRVPDFDGQRIEHPVSLAWIPNIISELVDSPTDDFPPDINTSILSSDFSLPQPIISDSLDAHGHTISIRNEKFKLLSHNSDKNTIETNYPFFNEDIIFQYRTDPTERRPLKSDPPEQLGSITEKIATCEREIPNLQGEFSEEVTQRLIDLGYKME